VLTSQASGRDLAETEGMQKKIHRGLRGRIEDGKSAADGTTHQPVLSRSGMWERIGARINKLLNLMLDDEIAVDEGEAEIKALDARRKRSMQSSRTPTSHRRCSIPRWPSCTDRR
jgi:hypothetical protein